MEVWGLFGSELYFELCSRCFLISFEFAFVLKSKSKKKLDVLSLNGRSSYIFSGFKCVFFFNEKIRTVIPTSLKIYEDLRVLRLSGLIVITEMERYLHLSASVVSLSVLKSLSAVSSEEYPSVLSFLFYKNNLSYA